MTKIRASSATIVEPTGVPASMDISIPKKAQPTENRAETQVTALKLLQSLIAVRDGKMISAEIRSDPTRFMARTIITAVITAISRFILSAAVPEAFEKFSSKVTANYLL